MTPAPRCKLRGATRRRLRARRRQQGFNLLEVMIAMVVLMLAAVGTASLQTATTISNSSARHRSTAMDFLQTWTERVKLDAMGWTVGDDAPSLFVGKTDNTWFVPTAAQRGALGETAATFWGLDTAVDSDTRYCISLRGEVLDPGRAVRADVRVWWYREGGDSPATVNATVPDGQGGSVTVTGPVESNRSLVPGGGCGDPADAPVADPRVHSAVVSTVLVVNG